MIDRELLDKVTHVVTHANCPDGVASAILLRDALEGVTIDFHTHGTDAFEKLEAKPGMLFCDLAPPHARIQEFVDVGAIVLDHHAKQEDDVRAFGPLGIFADLKTEPGVSGAALAFREVWAWRAPEGAAMWARAKAFATLAGIRDTWQTKHPLWGAARAQAEALRFYPWSFFEKLGEVFDSQCYPQLEALLAIGPVLVERADATVKRVVEAGVEVTTNRGTKLVIVSTTHTSDVADACDGADLVVGFDYGFRDDDVGLQLSMRSRGKYDVGALCKSLGGGGHVQAAGAHVHVGSGDLNPYEHIKKIVDDWEHGF